MAKRKTKKKAWQNFEVIKVRLNPEQAVLSCCALDSSRGIQHDLVICDSFECDLPEATWEVASS